MGQVANAVRHTATGVGRVGSGVGHGITSGARGIVGRGGAANGFVRNASSNLGQASRTCPIISECRDIAQGIAQGDFTKAAVNTGVLAFAATPAAGAPASKLATQSGTKQAMKIAALCTGHQALYGSVKNPAGVRSYTQSRQFSSFEKATLKPLPFPINGLEPVVSQKLMEFHYNKHHNTYVTNLNGLLEKAAAALEKGDHKAYVDLSQGIKFNGGGHMNHEFFWENLSPVSEKGGKLPAIGSNLYNAVEQAFGSFDKFIAHFSANTAAVQGSGWGWLAYNKVSGDLEFRTTANQDRLVDQGAHLVPILTIDIWEHAYYLDYQNVRPNFMKEIWKIVNWDKVAERLAAAKLA